MDHARSSILRKRPIRPKVRNSGEKQTAALERGRCLEADL